MYIHEAAKKAMEQKCLMVLPGTDRPLIGIQPTNGIESCIVHRLYKGEVAGPGWMPHADDLVSDKWELWTV